MEGLKIVEYGLKTIVLMLDIGFLLCFVLFQCGAWRELGIRKKSEKTDKCAFWMFFLISIFSGLVSIVLSGLVLMRWWT